MLGRVVCDLCGVVMPYGAEHTCKIVMVPRSRGMALPTPEIVAQAEQVMSNTKGTTPTRGKGRPRVHADRKAYLAEYQRQRRANAKPVKTS